MKPDTRKDPVPLVGALPKAAANDTLIGPKAKIHGDITFSGKISIEGEIAGEVMAKPSENTSIVVCDSGAVKGNIEAQSVDIEGSVEGNVHGDYVILRKGAEIRGDVQYGKLEIQEGASINGQLSCATSKSQSGRDQSESNKPSLSKKDP